METLERLIITEGAAEYLFNNAQAIVAPDFTGYITSYDKKAKIGIAITLDGIPLIFSNTGKPLSMKKTTKIISKLVKNKFLQLVIEPFPELANPFKKEFPLFKARIFESPIFMLGDVK